MLKQAAVNFNRAVQELNDACEKQVSELETKIRTLEEVNKAVTSKLLAARQDAERLDSDNVALNQARDFWMKAATESRKRAREAERQLARWPLCRAWSWIYRQLRVS